MLEPFPRLLAELQKLSPSVQGKCSEEWGAGTPSSRLWIRQSLSASLPGLAPEEQAAITNLDMPPRPRAWSLSVSHTPGMGGWVAVLRDHQIGWDVERKVRISPNIIQRVCQADEVTGAPHGSFLWCAKESFFKALEDFQPLTLPELTITNWQSTGPDLWTWTGLGPRNGKGVLIDSEPWLLAGCLIVS